MRAFLIAFICLSTLAMAQNVVVATPVVSGMPDAHATTVAASHSGGREGTDASGLTMSAGSEEAARRFVDRGVSHGPAASRATTMLLFVLGLSGLCAVGGRRHDRSQRQPI